jgi:hypothetical protein
MAIRQRSMLVAFKPRSSKNSSCTFGYASYIDKGTGNRNAETTHDSSRVTTNRYQKETGRTEQIKLGEHTRTLIKYLISL